MTHIENLLNLIRVGNFHTVKVTHMNFEVTTRFTVSKNYPTVYGIEHTIYLETKSGKTVAQFDANDAVFDIEENGKEIRLYYDTVALRISK